MIELTAREARRIAVRAQLLTSPRPERLVEVAHHLGAVQVDLTSHVAPSAELVFWSRLGRAFEASDLGQALTDRALIEHRGFLRPAGDIRLYTAEMAAWDDVKPVGWHPASARWVAENDHAREQILQALRTDGPLPAREIDVPFRRDWRSSGWNNSKNVPMMLERLEERGEVAVSHREGRERFWDLADRVHPADDPVPLAEALRARAERRLTSLGIARARGPQCPAEPQDVGLLGEEARIEGVRGTWQVEPACLEGAFRPRTALLSPLDRLVFDRKRMADVFAFDYALEMYKPATQRKWGYYALPVLHGDALIGKVDAEADHCAGVLRVHALHEDAGWAPSVRDAVGVELRSLARLLELDLDLDPGGA